MFVLCQAGNLSVNRTWLGHCYKLCYGLWIHSNLWRAENQMQQKIASLRDELSKKEQALRSITGKVGKMLSDL